MKYLLSFLLVTAALMASPTEAQEAPKENCLPYSQVAQAVGTQYGETLYGMGVAEQGSAIIQLYRNPKTNSFSLVAVLPSGKACMMVGGDTWETQENKPYTEESGS